MRKCRIVASRIYSITKENVEEFHRNGMKVNVWTVNKLENAEWLEEIGVDYITTNIIE